jgi:hypothetical protein
MPVQQATGWPWRIPSILQREDDITSPLSLRVMRGQRQRGGQRDEVYRGRDVLLRLPCPLAYDPPRTATWA